MNNLIYKYLLYSFILDLIIAGAFFIFFDVDVQCDIKQTKQTCDVFIKQRWKNHD